MYSQMKSLGVQDGKNHENRLKKNTKNFLILYIIRSEQKRMNITERGGSVVKHETHIWEVPSSNPSTDQPDGFFCGFPQLSRQMLGWIFITTVHLTIIHQIHISLN